MMSVFCSKTLIFAPECWKCILRGPDFKIFWEGMHLDSPRNRCELFPTPKFLPPTQNFIETLITHDYIHSEQK